MRLLTYIWDYLQHVGNFSGCHQHPAHSFKLWNGQKSPVCARCSGIYLGEFIGVIALLCNQYVSPKVLGVFLAVGVIDWFLQRYFSLMSNNSRRLITGIILGFALVQLLFFVLWSLV